MLTPQQLEDFTQGQLQAVKGAVTTCLSFKATSARGDHLRTEAADNKLKTQNCAVAASFNTETHQGIQLKTWYGKVQQILHICMLSSEPQLFLKVDWYKASIVGADPRVSAMPRVKCTGQATHDLVRQKPFIRADKIDHQVLIVAALFPHTAPTKTGPGYGCVRMCLLHTVSQSIF